MTDNIDNIKDFMSASVDEKPVGAYNAFNKELLSRTASILDDLKANVTQKMFNGKNGEEDEQTS